LLIKWHYEQAVYPNTKKPIESNALGTIELSTGLQVSGVFTNVIAHEGKPIYIQTKGKKLWLLVKKRIGHGILSHAEGSA
jgi:phenylalanine-4-hydroxylase